MEMGLHALLSEFRMNGDSNQSKALLMRLKMLLLNSEDLTAVVKLW